MAKRMLCDGVKNLEASLDYLSSKCHPHTREAGKWPTKWRRCYNDGSKDCPDVAAGHGMLASSGLWKDKAWVPLPWNLWKELDF